MEFVYTEKFVSDRIWVLQNEKRPFLSYGSLNIYGNRFIAIGFTR